MRIIKSSVFLSGLTIIAFALFTFWDLPRTFYQQDEWQSLGHYLVDGLSLPRVNPILLIFGDLRQLSIPIYFVLLGMFKFNVVPAYLFGIFFHTINAFLIFHLVKKLTKKELIAAVSALFFIVNSVSHQAVTWISAVTTVPAVTFALVSIIWYLKFIEKNDKKHLFASLITLLISIYIKGVAFFIFALLPVIYFLYKPKVVNWKNIIKVLKINWPFVALGLILLVFKLGQFFLRSGEVVGYVSVGPNSNIFQTLILRAILYPLTSLFQIFIPPIDFYPMMSQITTNQYKFLIASPVKELVAQSVVSDLISVIGSFAILFLLFVLIKKSKDKLIQRNIIFALLFFASSMLIYVFLDRDSSYLSPRYFYLAAVPGGILFGYLFDYLFNFNKYLKVLILIFVSLYLLHHINVIRNDIDSQVKLGNERKAVLSGIKILKPQLDDKTVFYVTSDKEYYGPVTNPFQNGLGYVLEVWYYDGNNISKEFLRENFLWDLGAEGYREVGDKGFGYFQDIDKITKQVEMGKFDTKNVYSFFIKSKEQKVVDITEETRERISTISGTLQ